MTANNNIFLVAQHKGDRERSVDILSLQSEFENSYLNKIMPGISVLTLRFRYMSFICWVISNNIDPRSEDFRLLEDAIAKTEYEYKHALQGATVGPYKGSRNIKDSDPHYYVQSVFGDYRNTMEGFGLLKPDNNLTEDGKWVAQCFGKSVGNVPRNITAAANNGFAGLKKSLLSLSREEKRKYQELFVQGGQEAKYRKKYSSVYRKLLKQNSLDIDYEVDSTDLALLSKNQTDPKINRNYPVALAMFNYMYVVYCFVKAMHCIYHYLERKQDNKIAFVDAANLRDVRPLLEEGLSYKKRIAWHASIEELKWLLNSSSGVVLLRNLLKRFRLKGDRAWLLMDGEYIKLNPLKPPLSKRVRPFGIRLAPYASLMADLRGR